MTIKDILKRTNKLKLFLLPLIIGSLIIAGCSESAEDHEGHGQLQEVKKGGKTYYTCPMHPQVVSDRPGSCPICGMDLVKKTEETSPDQTAADKNIEEMIALNGNKIALSNVTLAKVQRGSLDKEVTAYSYLDFAEQNRKLITARFNGRIERLFVNQTGGYIRKGQALFEIYSPDIVQAQNEYLIALENSHQSMSVISSAQSATPQSGASARQNTLLSSAKKKLELFGVTSAQIKSLEKTGEVKLTMTYYSPVSGTVIEKKVQEGQYLNEGAVIYDVADMSTLWSISEVYEKDIQAIKTGSRATLNLQAYPERTFEGRVTFVYPVLNSASRTVKVRSEFSNKGGLLKPQMYGQTTFRSHLGMGLLVPSGAVLFTGKRNVVWVRTSDGMFEARTVEVGGRFGDNYQVLSGLREGDEVAATGGFLIDSESQLNSGNGSGHQHENMNTNGQPQTQGQPEGHSGHSGR